MSPSGQVSEPHTTSDGATKKVLANVGALAFSGLLSKIFTFIYTLWVVRNLSQTGYGSAIVAATWVGFLAVATDLGLVQVASRDIAKSPERQAGILASVLRVTLVTTFLLFATAQALAWPFYDLEIRKLIFICSLAMLASPLILTVSAALNGIQDMGPLARIQAVGTILKTCAAFPLLYLFPSAIAFLSLELGVTVITAFWLTALGGKRGLFPPREKPDPEITRRMLREGLSYFLSFLIFMVYNRLDFLLLDHFKGVGEVAIYALAYKLYEGVVMLGRPVGGALYPALSAKASQPEAFAKAVRKSFAFMFALGAFWAGAMIFLARAISLIRTDYAAAEGLLMALMLGIPFYFFSYPLSNALNANGRHVQVMLITLSGAVINLILNVVLIPLYGAAAAAWINAATVVYFGLAYLISIKRMLPGLRLADQGVFVVLAAVALGGGAGGLANQFSPVAGLAGFSAVFGGFLWFFYPLDTEDKVLLHKIKGKIFRYLPGQAKP